LGLTFFSISQSWTFCFCSAVKGTRVHQPTIIGGGNKLVHFRDKRKSYSLNNRKESGENMNREYLKTIPKPQIPEIAKHLTKDDVAFLVEMLSEKEDMVRYHAFLLLQENSRHQPYTYEHWDQLEAKLDNTNSYQRSLGLMLMAENVRWDKAGKFAKVLNQYLECCMDEKFITARQAIQGLANVIEATDQYDDIIKQRLAFLTFAQYKENQQSLLNKDAANILKRIAKKQSN
jgi:hypothetical protein